MSVIKIGTARILTGIGYVLLAAAAVYFGGYAALAICFVIVALLTKIIGCGLGSKICGYSLKESLRIGIYL